MYSILASRLDFGGLIAIKRVMMPCVFDRVLEMIFPPKCAICGSIAPDVLCKTCVAKIQPFSGSHIMNGLNMSVASSYEGVMKKAIKKFKFMKKKQLAKPLGAYFWGSIQMLSFDVIIPVPLHRNRMRERGFNQCELLGSEIALASGAPMVSNVLLRIIDTKPQFRLNRSQRFANIAGAFSLLEPLRVTGKTVLLIDDITTSGATIGQCSAVLLANGAKNVICASLSRAVTPVI